MIIQKKTINKKINSLLRVRYYFEILPVIFKTSQVLANGGE